MPENNDRSELNAEASPLDDAAADTRKPYEAPRLLKKRSVAPDGVVETGEEHLFGGGWRNFERERSERSDFRNQAEKKCQEPGP